MDIRLFGVGPGVIILVLLWSLTFLLSISLGKTNGIAVIIGLALLSALISLLLISWPIEQIDKLNRTIAEVTQYDHVFIPRLLLVTFLSVVVLIALVQYLTRTVLTTTAASCVRNRHQQRPFNEQYLIR
ncbi:unnamed protein product [Heligmosomoides polygyrus]|uniref:Aa_trans domain-containing protein n=1 Tax=Heligmosomoides polygyrus TaxID=6339 RepID=A0A183FG92_HELPZ|nr:unnamed protein product [Heligmosomoides polygyrus]